MPEVTHPLWRYPQTDWLNEFALVSLPVVLSVICIVILMLGIIKIVKAIKR